MPAPAPTLQTERLVLRPHRLEDFADSAALWSDPQVVRFIGGRAFTEEEVWARLLRYIGHWAALGYGFWVVHEKDGGPFVGEVGFADFHRELEPGFGGTPEMGWALAPTAHGKGYASEAIAAALNWGENNLDAERMVCMINPDNAPSIKAAKKAGFKEYQRTTYKGAPTVLFERHAAP